MKDSGGPDEGSGKEPVAAERPAETKAKRVIESVTAQFLDLASRLFPEETLTAANASSIRGLFLAIDIAVISAVVHAGYGSFTGPRGSSTYAEKLSTLLEAYGKLEFVQERSRIIDAFVVERTKANLLYIFQELKSYYRKRKRNRSRDNDKAERKLLAVRKHLREMAVGAATLFHHDKSLFPYELSKDEEKLLLHELDAIVEDERVPFEAATNVTQTLCRTTKNFVKNGASTILGTMKPKASYEVIDFLDENLGRGLETSGE